MNTKHHIAAKAAGGATLGQKELLPMLADGVERELGRKG